MRRKYPAAQVAVWNKRFYEKRRKMGWITCSFLVPESVGVKIQNLKRKLMEEHKKQLVKKKTNNENTKGKSH
jgi:hypothetical protein